MQLTTMKLTDLIREFGYLTRKTWTPADIEHRARQLREARMLPTGVGRQSPEVGPAQAVPLVIALGAADRAVDVAAAVARYAPMPPVGGLGASFCGAGTFGEALAEVLADAEWRYGVQRATIRRNWPEASITWRQRDEDRTAVYRPEGTPERGYGDAVHVDVSFGAGFLAQIAAAFLKPPVEQRGGFADDPHVKDYFERLEAYNRSEQRQAAGEPEDGEGG